MFEDPYRDSHVVESDNKHKRIGHFILMNKNGGEGVETAFVSTELGVACNQQLIFALDTVVTKEEIVKSRRQQSPISAEPKCKHDSERTRLSVINGVLWVLFPNEKCL